MSTTETRLEYMAAMSFAADWLERHTLRLMAERPNCFINVGVSTNRLGTAADGGSTSNPLPKPVSDAR